MSADLSTQIVPFRDEELNVRAKGRAVLAIAMTPQADKLRARPSPRPLLVHAFWVVVEDGRFAFDGGGHVEATSILTFASRFAGKGGISIERMFCRRDENASPLRAARRRHC